MEPGGSVESTGGETVSVSVGRLLVAGDVVAGSLDPQPGNAMIAVNTRSAVENDRKRRFDCGENIKGSVRWSLVFLRTARVVSGKTA
jgi:hypothetical protein